MNKPHSYRTPEGFTLTEVEFDLYGRLTLYEVVGTRYFLTRTPTGWRAQLQPNGRAKRSYIGPGWGEPRACLRYLIKYGKIVVTDL